jgi:hypothetical protein
MKKNRYDTTVPYLIFILMCVTCLRFRFRLGNGGGGAPLCVEAVSTYKHNTTQHRTVQDRRLKKIIKEVRKRWYHEN